MYSPTHEYVVPRSIPIAGPELDMMGVCVCVAGYQGSKENRAVACSRVWRTGIGESLRWVCCV